MRDCEVVIVGCGPSGNTLAYRLAREGREVLLLERETLPRVKVCGGGLSRKTLTEIHYSVEEVVEGKVGDVLLARGSEHVVDRSLPEVGVTVRREALDNFMARKAVEAGAELKQGCRFERYEDAADGVHVRTTRGEIRAKVLVGADGAYSTVRRQLYPSARLRMVPAIEALVSPPEGAFEALRDRVLFDLDAIRGGYAWIFPKKDHLNVGLYRFLKTRNNRDLKRRLLEWIGDSRLLREHRGLEIRPTRSPCVPWPSG